MTSRLGPFRTALVEISPTRPLKKTLPKGDAMPVVRLRGPHGNPYRLRRESSSDRVTISAVPSCMMGEYRCF
jgi:hypothetical protein